MRSASLLLLVLLLPGAVAAQPLPDEGPTERTIVFPDVPGFKVLKCDLHTHSVFSDGSVWPSIRVQMT